MNFINTKPAITAADFDGVDRELGFPLPDDLRAHYLRFNGGHPVPNVFSKGGDLFAIQEFLPIKYGKRGDCLEDTYKTIVIGNEHFPSNMIPIAYDAAGDYFCYSTDPSDFGKIYFFQSEYFDDPKRALVFLTNDFPTFLASLVAA